MALTVSSSSFTVAFIFEINIEAESLKKIFIIGQSFINHCIGIPEMRFELMPGIAQN